MEKPVKVLYFVDRMLRGGIQSLVIDWVSRFDRKKIQVDFLLLDDGKKYELEDTLKELGCNVFKLSNVWIRTPYDYIKQAKALNTFFKDHRDYKVVHLHSSSKNYLVMKYAKKYNIPIRITHSHNTEFQTRNFLKILYGNLLKSRIKKYSTDYFACSKLAGEWMYGKKNINDVKVIHNAVDFDKFKFKKTVRNKIRVELSVKDNELLFGHVGRFTTQKNHPFLIDIFYEIYKKNNNSKLLLIGMGLKENEIKNKVRNLGIQDNVIFSGFKNNVNDYLQAMDVFLLPSLYEGLPVVGVEAQAAGLPAFMTDTITNEVKIAENVKFISLNKSAKDWAEIILTSNLTRMDNKSVIKKAGYFIEDVISDLEKFYLK